MAATVSRGTTATRVLGRSGAPRHDLPPIVRADGIFAEEQFDWPEPPGDEKKEAKLPLFRFRDLDEARFFLWLFVFNNVVAVIGCLNIVLGHNRVIGNGALLIGIISNVVFIRLWIRLCKRAHPVPAKVHWWTSGILSLVTWQAISQAKSVLRDR